MAWDHLVVRHHHIAQAVSQTSFEVFAGLYSVRIKQHLLSGLQRQGGFACDERKVRMTHQPCAGMMASPGGSA